jgi:hypothetical protein
VIARHDERGAGRERVDERADEPRSPRADATNAVAAHEALARGEADAAVAAREAAVPNAADTTRATAGQVLALQRHAGNAAVGRLLQRHEEDAATAVAEPQAAPAPAGPAAAPAAGQAAAEAIAVETVTRINKAIAAMAKETDNPTVSNTAELLQGPTPRVRFTPMTPRSDSETIRTARGQAAGTVVYYFTGTSQPPLGPNPGTPPAGTIEFGPNTMGTIQGDNLLVIRGRYGNGNWRSEDELKGTLIHESSHILVKSYGEHPDTTKSAASFDRYKDEFRAYFIEQYGPYSGEKNLDKRAERIKTHLIGTSLTDTRGYSDLRTAYWSKPVGDPFRTDIDNHKRPDGFNLTNSIRLDRFFAALGPAATDPLAAVDEVMAAISHLTAAERTEALASNMIKAKVAACGADAEKRILAALGAPTKTEYTSQLNPSSNPKIARLYEEIARSSPEKMRDAYTALKAEERLELQFNAATMVYVDHNVLDSRKRACVYAMLTSLSATQYTAMDDFLEQCFLAYIGEPATEIPPDLRAAAKRLTLNSRLALYRLVEPARKEWVEILPAPVSQPLIKILRGDADP